MTNSPLYIELGVLARQFNKDLDKALGRLDGFADKALKVGGAMSIGISAPLGLLYNKMLNLYDVQSKAIAQVETGLRTTGNAAGFTSQQLQKMASDLQNNSLFGDEEILQNATAQLLTFTNIAGEQFARTEQASLDLATRLDGDLKGASIMLGKALNDPVANLSALGRAGIQFSKSQQDVIKGLAEGGRMAEAQSIILNELERQYGGSAKAAADAGAGWRTQLNNIIGDVQESFGEIINDALKPFGLMLKNIALRLNDLSPSAKKAILVVSGLAFAAGPLIVGIGTIIKLLPIVKAGLLAMRAAVLGVSWPIVAITAGIVGLAAAFVYVRDNLEAFKQRFINGFTWIRNKFVDIIKGIAMPYLELAKLLGLDIADEAYGYFDSLKGVVIENTKEFGSFNRAVNNALKDLGLLTNMSSPEIAGGGGIVPPIDPAPDAPLPTVGLGDPKKSKFAEMDVDSLIGVTQIREGKLRLIDSLAELAGIDYKGAGDKIASKFKDGFVGVKNVINEEFWAIQADLNSIKEVIKDAIKPAFGVLGDSLALGFQSIFDKTIDFKSGFKRILGQFLSSLGEAVMKMAIELKAVAALKTKIEAALTSFGGGAIGLIGAATLFSLGAALKGGGAALANAGTSNIGGGNFRAAPSYNNGGRGDQRMIIEFANGSLEGAIEYNRARNGL